MLGSRRASTEDLLKDRDRRIKELERENAELKERVATIESEVNKLRADLAFYQNPHTPPSQRKVKPKRKRRGGGKRGAPKGHPGTTRPTPEPDEYREATCSNCPNCTSANIKRTGSKKKLLEDIPEIVRTRTVEYEVEGYECGDCGAVFWGVHQDLPKTGNFGINLMVTVVMIKFLLRGVLRKGVGFLATCFGMKLAPATFNEIVGRVADAAQAEYEALRLRIRESGVVHIDETGISVLGKNRWIWIFRSGNDVLFVIRPSRGHDVLYEVLGKDYPGIVVCDGWRAYNLLRFAVLQRCWAHLLREVEAVSDSVHGRNFYGELHDIFEEIKRYNSRDHSEKSMQRKFAELEGKLDRIVRYYSRYPDLRKAITYISNGKGNWFTCIIRPEAEPTNNAAEQPLREMVIVRKIIGAIRSERGCRVYERLGSLIATWTLRGEDVSSNLKGIMVREALA